MTDSFRDATNACNLRTNGVDYVSLLDRPRCWRPKRTNRDTDQLHPLSTNRSVVVLLIMPLTAQLRHSEAIETTSCLRALCRRLLVGLILRRRMKAKPNKLVHSTLSDAGSGTERGSGVPNRSKFERSRLLSVPQVPDNPGRIDREKLIILALAGASTRYCCSGSLVRLCY